MGKHKPLPHIEGLLHAREIAQRLTFDHTYIRQLCREGKFPQYAEIHERALYWREADVYAWADARGIHYEGKQ